MNIRVTTFNMRFATANDGKNSWTYRKPLVQKFLHDNRADIFCFQEVLPHIKTEFREHFGCEYIEFGCGRNKKLLDEAALVAFRRDRFELLEMESYWLSDTPKVIASKFYDTCYHARICTYLLIRELKSGALLRIFNTHLDNECRKSMKKGTELIMKISDEKNSLYDTHTIFCGDLNEQPDFILPIVSNSGSGFVDVSDLSGRKINYTYHEFNKQSEFKKIDYIFVKGKHEVKNMDICDLEKDGVYLSDHFPITVDLELIDPFIPE